MQKAKPILCVRVQCLGVSWQNLGKLWLALKVEKQYTKNRSTLPGPHSKSKADLEIEGLHNQVPVCVTLSLCVKERGRGCETMWLQVIQPVPSTSIYFFPVHNQHIRIINPQPLSWPRKFFQAKLSIASSLTQTKSNHFCAFPKVTVVTVCVV